MNGSVTLCSGSDSALHLLHSMPRTPSPLIMLGQVRVMVIWLLSAVKIDQHVALGRFAAGLVIEVDQLLVVALHEINLDALDAPFLQTARAPGRTDRRTSSRPPTG